MPFHFSSCDLNPKLKILALEAYYGGSHKAFLDAWIARSRHEWTVYDLPPSKWKWRMRHSAVTFANRIAAAGSSTFDAVFCSDMTNLAEFRGLVSPEIAQLPMLLYFHENQLTYPTAKKDTRDHHFAFSNLVSALSADAVWFNSEYHRTSFLEAMTEFLKRMPDHQELVSIERIGSRSQIWPPGIESIGRSDDAPHAADEGRPAGDRPALPLHIVWAARWEFDKNPEDFFAAMFALDAAGFDFRLSVLGESFHKPPDIFAEAQERLSHRIAQWGFLPTRADYIACLRSADLIVSTAIHEFFGISVVEAISAGAIPVLPARLSYPEILAVLRAETKRLCLFDGSVASLVESIMTLAPLVQAQTWRANVQAELAAAIGRFQLDVLAPEMDDQLVRLVNR
jgi:glycosyltransferase involved in cell wall biosynthesis